MKYKTMFKSLFILTGLAAANTAFAVQPAYSSRPTAQKVFYIDYDGEAYIDSSGNWNLGPNFYAEALITSNAEIEASWSYVAEAYKAYDVNVTTDRSVYDATPVNQRQMCIVTSDETAAPGNGGVAKINSFYGDDTCWSFKITARTIVHELGHTVGLLHDGLVDAEYHPGGAAWAPHMGSGSSILNHFSIGEYYGATNDQDDLALINDYLDFVTDEAPDTLGLAASGSATSLTGTANTGLSTSFSAIISRTGGGRVGGHGTSGVADVDVYRFDVPPGAYDFDITVSPAESKLLDIEITVHDSSWQEISAGDPNYPSSISLQGSTITDTIYLVVRGGNSGNPFSPSGSGWTNYGNIGEYNVSFDATRTVTTSVPDLGFAPLPEASNTSVISTSGIGKTVGQVTANDPDAGDTALFSIIEGNTGGAFTIDPVTGIITVADSLSYSVQSAYLLRIRVTDSEGLSNTVDMTINLDTPVVYNENLGGDLSNNNNTPTPISLTLGFNTIIGKSGRGGPYNLPDDDYFTVTVPEGMEISAIFIGENTSEELLVVHRFGSPYPYPTGYGYSDDQSSAGPNSSLPLYPFSNIGAEGDHYFMLGNIYPSGETDYEVTIELTENNIHNWQSIDIGNVAAAGSTAINGPETTITASGADIWGNNDEFHFAYETLIGDGVITARVNGITNTNDWAKAGVMIRETLDADSANAAMLLTANAGTNSQSRATAGASTATQRGFTGASAPYWVRLERIGDTFKTSESVDGYIWTEVKTWTVPMSEQVYIGLAVTSHNDGVVTTAVMDYVSISPSDIDITYNAADFDSESHPADENIIRDMDTKIGYITNGSWVAYDDFNFVSGAINIDLTASSALNESTVEVRLDSPTGPLISSVLVTPTGDWNSFATFTGAITEVVEGLHDLYFAFTGSGGTLLDVADFTVSTSATSSSNLGVEFGAAEFSAESHPTNDNIIQSLGTKVGYIRKNSWIRFDDFNFGSEASSITLSASSGSTGGTVEVRTGSATGPIIGSVVVTNTGDWNSFQSFSADFDSIVSGVGDLYLVFTGANGFLMDLESFQVDALANPGNLGIEFGAAEFSAESHPTDDNIINHTTRGK